MDSISTSLPYHSDSSTNSSPVQPKVDTYSENHTANFQQRRLSTCSNPSCSQTNNLHNNGCHSIIQTRSHCLSPCQLNYQKPSMAGASSPTRYQSTPPSSRCFADTINPIPTFVIKEGEKSNNVDFQVKLALTDLLNCEDIKADQETRMWVQNRLMDTEHRLKARRKSRICSVHFD